MLVIESLGATGSVAAFEGDRCLLAAALDPTQKTAQSLAPGVQQLLAQVEWRVADLEAVAVTTGPGSFTGLRVGVTTAKSLAYACGAALLGVSSLESIAAQAVHVAAERLWAVIDAGRDQQFAACFDHGQPQPPVSARAGALWEVAGWRSAFEPAITDNASLIARLRAGDAISGPGLSKLIAVLPGGVEVVDDWASIPRASDVGRLAAAMISAGVRDDVLGLVPNYLRHSAAEEKWLARK